ncbi:hypothetical protein HGK51_06815 [Helicobacter pylori]|uniref:HP0423 family protein n=1 Tax=Helicobacter pylori TaxID=210 RepID=A0ABD7CDQ8_HELPX|nr:hypothetical protein [Helicobacter pylori]QQX00009.1 hypothetical protein HGK51_06815 [Helicobacter pylori]
MGFQNENQLKLGALVKTTINDKVVEAKVISVGFNRVTLRSQKGNEVSYAFNSEKFLKWFNHVPLSEVAKNHAESGKKDLLEGLKIVTSGPSVKERTSTPKEKEDKYKLAFGFKKEGLSSFEITAEDYTLAERKSRLGVLLSPMFYEGKGNQITAIIVTAITHAKNLNKHSDAEWSALIENRNTERCYYDTLDYMDRVGTTLFCNVIREYALRLDKELEAELNDFSPSGFWANLLPKNKNEALFIAQLLSDGGINKYGLSCAGLTENLLKDIELTFGLATPSEIDEYLANLDNEEGVEN